MAGHNMLFKFTCVACETEEGEHVWLILIATTYLLNFPSTQVCMQLCPEPHDTPHPTRENRLATPLLLDI